MIKSKRETSPKPLSHLRRLRKNAIALQRGSYVVLAVAFFRCMTVGTVREPVVLGLLAVFLAMALASVGISAKFWKCPCCGKLLEIRSGQADRTGKCPYCGKEL